jgi:hypothetical protein
MAGRKHVAELLAGGQDNLARAAEMLAAAKPAVRSSFPRFAFYLDDS